jgi:hypothetical protein
MYTHNNRSLLFKTCGECGQQTASTTQVFVLQLPNHCHLLSADIQDQVLPADVHWYLCNAVNQESVLIVYWASFVVVTIKVFSFLSKASGT